MEVGLANELKAVPGRFWNTVRLTLFYYLWSPLYLCWRPLLFIGMLCGPFVLARTRYFPLAAAGTATAMYHLLVVCVLEMPFDRYVIPTLLAELLVAAPCAFELRRRLALSRGERR